MSDLAAILTTLALLAVLGFPVRGLLRRVGVPPAVSLMALGVALGSHVLGALPEGYTAVSGALSRAAFVVLLLRAGLALDPGTLRAILVPSVVFGVLPVVAEWACVVALSRAFLFDSWYIALLAGFLVAAVSPAVVLPTMLNVKDAGLGTRRLVPDRIMGQTVVNAFVAQTGILLLVAAARPGAAAGASLWDLALLPVGVVGGMLVGAAAGGLLPLRALVGDAPRDPEPRRVVSTWGVPALVVVLGGAVYFGCTAVGLESVFATLAVGSAVRWRLPRWEPRLREQLRHVWSVAEIVLFVNLGAAIDLGEVGRGSIVLLILAVGAVALLARVAVARWLARRTDLEAGEQRYVAFAHVPKATIQAVFAAYPLHAFEAWGLAALIPDARILLIMGALAILATAPVGAVMLERTAARLLPRDEEGGRGGEPAGQGGDSAHRGAPLSSSRGRRSA